MTVRPRTASAATNARGSKAASGGWTPAAPAAGDHVGGDGGHGPGDGRGGGTAGLLDREVVGQRDRGAVADPLDPDVLDVGASVVGADAATPDVGGGEPAGRDGRPVQVERLVTIEPELEQGLDPARLVGRIADLEDNVGDIDGPGQGDRLRVRNEMDLLRAVRLGEGERLRPGEGRALDEDAVLEHDRRAGTGVEAGDDDPGRGPHRVGDVRVEADGPDGVELVGAEPGEDVGQARGDTAAGDDPTTGRLGGGSPVELLERLRVVRTEVDQVDAGRDGRIGDPDVVAHVGRVEDDLGPSEGRRERCRVLHVDQDDAFGRREPTEQGAGRVDPQVADGDLVVGPLDEVGDGRRPHLAGAAEDEDPGHEPGAGSGRSGWSGGSGRDARRPISWGARSCWPGRRPRSPGWTCRRSGTRSPRTPRDSPCPRRSRRRSWRRAEGR